MGSRRSSPGASVWLHRGAMAWLHCGAALVQSRAASWQDFGSRACGGVLGEQVKVLWLGVPLRGPCGMVAQASHRVPCQVIT